MIITKDLMETTTATRFNLLTNDDYYFRHSSCLFLKNVITNNTMQLIWRKKSLEVIPNEVKKQNKNIFNLLTSFVLFSLYQLVNISINFNVILFHYNHIFLMFNQQLIP